MDRVRIRMHPHRRYVSENSEPQIGLRREAPGQPYGVGMTEDEGYRLEDDGTEGPEDCDEDSFDSRLAVLRDIMDGYDWSFLLDVRDPLFVSRLREALGFLGLAMEMRAGPPVGEGRFFRSDAEIVLCMARGGSSARTRRSSCAWAMSASGTAHPMCPRIRRARCWRRPGACSRPRG